MRHFVGRVPLAALALWVVAALTSCSTDNSAPTASTDGAGTIQQFDAADRPKVGEFEGELLGGGTTTAEDLEGVVTVVNIWGSWCGPCRIEAPDLRRVANEYADRGVRFLGLNVRDNDAAARAFEDRYDIPYDSVTSDDSPRVTLAFAGRLTTAAVPMTVVVDRDRQIAARVVGVVTAATLRALVDDVLGESGQARGPDAE